MYDRISQPKFDFKFFLFIQNVKKCFQKQTTISRGSVAERDKVVLSKRAFVGSNLVTGVPLSGPPGEKKPPTPPRPTCFRQPKPTAPNLQVNDLRWWSLSANGREKMLVTIILYYMLWPLAGNAMWSIRCFLISKGVWNINNNNNIIPS